MAKSFGYHFLLLAGSLGLAFFASIPRKESDHGEKEWVRIDTNKLKRLNLVTENSETTVKPQSTNGYWVSFTTQENEKANPLAVGEPKKKTKEKTLKSYEFKANNRFSAILEEFNPLMVQREVGNLDHLDLSAFGLAERKRVFQIEAGDTTHEFLIGKKSYGSSNFFVADVSRKKVILLGGSWLDSLMNAKTRLYERNIVDIELDRVDSVELLMGTKKIEWIHESQEKGKRIWKKKNQGEDSRFGRWVKKLVRLQVEEYSSSQPDREVKTLFTVSFKRQEEVVEQLQFLKWPQGDEVSHWVRTQFLGVHVRLNSNRSKTIEQDLPIILEPISSKMDSSKK